MATDQTALISRHDPTSGFATRHQIMLIRQDPNVDMIWNDAGSSEAATSIATEAEIQGRLERVDMLLASFDNDLCGDVVAASDAVDATPVTLLGIARHCLRSLKRVQ